MALLDPLKTVVHKATSALSDKQPVARIDEDELREAQRDAHFRELAERADAAVASDR
jgi:hypothetical protein